MKSLLIAGLAVALGVGLAGTPATASAGADVAAGQPVTASTSVRAEAASQSGVKWGPCHGQAAGFRLKCAKLAVPLNHRRPHGRQIHLAISLREHTSSAADYRGIMLVNPGGPGGSGLTLAALQSAVPGTSAGRYDWIGFDPRGVGASTPSLHCSRAYFGPDRPSYIPTTKRLLHYWMAKARAYTSKCRTAKAKQLLRFMTTPDSARDMDAIRKALGQQKISYYGFSYGTYLGAVYAQLFPKRVDRMVLDGVVNPGRVWYGANLDQDRAFDRNMDVYWRYLARHDSAFHLGTRWKKIKRGYYAELKVLARHPSAGGRLGPDELGDALLDAGYYVYDWVQIGHAYANLINKNRGQALYAAYRSSNMGDDNGFAVYNAVQCTDNPWPGWKKTAVDSSRINRMAPFLTWGNTWYNAPCLTWPARSQHRLKINGRGLTSKVLLISETRDAATPYSGALALRKRFRTASLIAGVGGTTHASSLSGVGCVDNTIATYLGTGKVPARKSGNRADKRCPHVPAPQPTTGSARVGGQSGPSAVTSAGMSTALREAFEAAQRTMLRG